jgi:putative DNA primase/helicase
VKVDGGTLTPEQEAEIEAAERGRTRPSEHPVLKIVRPVDVSIPLNPAPPADLTDIPLGRGLVGDARSEGKPHINWSDFTTRGNGERLLEAHGRDLRHAPEAGWFEWDGQRWASDAGDKRALRRAMETMLAMALEARVQPNLDAEDHKFVDRSQGPGAWSSALTTASLLAPIATTFDAFDDGPRAAEGHALRLNVANGTIDLATGLLRPARREDMITKLCGASFDPAADQGPWLAFLARAQPDPEIRAFLQRLAGSWLRGDVRDEVFPIFWGQGGNGKGTFLDTIRRALGDYAGTVPEDVLISQHSKPHPTGLMIFRGLRLAVASETDEGDTLAIATLKRLTGGDSIRARFMNKDFIEFAPTHKLVMMTNARPRLRGNVTAALRRRFFFIPWETTIAREDMDTELKAKLSAPEALSAVLAWMLEGYRVWQTLGLAPPASVLSATEDYIASEDVLGSFVEERLEFGPGLEVTADHLYKAYRDYLKEVGETSPVRPQDFAPALLGKPLAVAAKVTHKRTKKARMYFGVGIRAKTAEELAEREEQGRGRWGARPS